MEAALLHTSGSQQSGHIKSRHALNGGPQNKRNALFRSSYVALVMPDTAREREREIEQGERCMAKGHERRKNRKRRLSQAGCTSPTPIHSVRVLLPRLLASPLPTHPPPPLISQDFVRAFPICSYWRWFHCAHDSVDFQYRCITHAFENMVNYRPSTILLRFCYNCILYCVDIILIYWGLWDLTSAPLSQTHHECP